MSAAARLSLGMGAELQAALKTAITLGRPGTIRDTAGAAYLLCLEETAYSFGEVLICGGGYAL